MWWTESQKPGVSSQALPFCVEMVSHKARHGTRNSAWQMPRYSLSRQPLLRLSLALLSVQEPANYSSAALLKHERRQCSSRCSAQCATLQGPAKTVSTTKIVLYKMYMHPFGARLPVALLVQ